MSNNATPSLAIVTDVAGKVWAIAEDGIRHLLGEGDSVDEGDVIFLEAGAFVVLRSVTGAVLKLTEGKEVTLSSNLFERGENSFNLDLRGLVASTESSPGAAAPTVPPAVPPLPHSAQQISQEDSAQNGLQALHGFISVKRIEESVTTPPYQLWSFTGKYNSATRSRSISSDPLLDGRGTVDERLSMIELPLGYYEELPEEKPKNLIQGLSNRRRLNYLPKALDDKGEVYEGRKSITGNVLTNDSDGNGPSRVAFITFLHEGDGTPVSTPLPLSGSITVDTLYGTLTISSDGKWSYISDLTEIHGADDVLYDIVQYTISDVDGDTVSASLVIDVLDTLPVTTQTSFTVNEKNLPNGTSPLPSGLIVEGSLGVIVTADEIISTRFTIATGDPSGLASNGLTVNYYRSPDGKTLTAYTGSDPTTNKVFTVVITEANPNNPLYSFALLEQLDHADDSGTNIKALSFGYEVTDKDGDKAQGAISVDVIDDVPVLTPQSTSVNEANLLDGTSPNSEKLSSGGPLTIIDADEIISTKFTIASGTESGLTSNGLTVNYKLSTDGKTLTAYTGDNPALNKVFTVVITEADPNNPQYNFTLQREIDHANGTNTKALGFGYEVTDRDGDKTEGILSVNITDNQPDVTSPPKVTVNEANLVDGTDPNSGALNTDGALGTLHDATNIIFTIATGNPSGLTSNGLTVNYYRSPDGKTLTAYTGSDPTTNKVFTVIITDDDPVNPQYSFTLQGQLDHADANSTNIKALNFGYEVTGNEGNTARGAISVDLIDDIPAIGAPVNSTVYEKNLPTGSDPNTPLLTTNKTLAIIKDADAIDVTFNDPLPPTGLQSGGSPVSYTVNGHTLTAQTAAGESVFTIVINNPASGSATYTFTLIKPLDHVGVDFIDLPIKYKVTDFDKDTASQHFTVAIEDDNSVPSAVMVLNEDSSKTVTINADAAGHTTITGIAAHGTTTLNADGTLTYSPNANYSGQDAFTYTLVNDYGPDTITTVAVTVNPVSDAPIVLGTSVATPEDQPIALGLTAPAVRDSIDQNGATVGDDPERFGLITLGGIPEGAQLLKSDGTVLFTGTASDHDVTIRFTDSSYINGLPVADLTTLSSADFNALKILPPPDSNTNFTITMSVTEYEVDGSGNQKTVNAIPVPGVSATVNDVITVTAVTDHVDLKWQSTAPDTTTDPLHPDSFDSLPLPARTDIDTGYGYIYDSQEDGTLNKWIAEDSTFNLKSLLEYTAVDTADAANSVFGNPPEMDGSEHRYIVLNNLPKGMVVNGTTIDAGGTISIRLTGDITLPDINITLPPDFSGNIQGIKVTLTTMDTDIAGETTLIVQKEDFVMLNLYVTPVANDIVAPDVSTPEDTAVKFMQNMAVSDALNGGVELITAITILDLTSGWVIRNSSGSAVFTGNGADDYTLPSGDLSGGTYINYTVQPPAQSSLDTTVKVSVTTTDTATVNGVDVTDTKTVEHDIVVTVTPVAEVMGLDINMDGVADNLLPVTHPSYGTIYPDSDGNSAADLRMNGSFKFSAVNEDTAIPFNGSSGFYVDQHGVAVPESPSSFDFQTAWFNTDGSSIAPEGSERTWALLIPMTSANKLLLGSTFTYNDGDGSLKTILYQGSPIEIESKYLSTVTFQPPPYFAEPGIKVVVQAKTVDSDQDNPAITNTKITGEVVLTFDYTPVADQATLAVTSPVGVNEDSQKQLFIRPTTTDTDGSESFTVVITGIPDGSEMIYNGVTIYAKTDTTGKVTIPLFDTSKVLTIQPPLNSNDDPTLQVMANTVELLNGDLGPVSQTLDIVLDIKGVADTVTLGTTTPGFAESRLDIGTDTIAMSSVITSATLFDNDGSEKLSVSFTGLADGFAIEDTNVAFLGGSGTTRRWLLTQADLATAKISVPKNFSGTINFMCAPVTTENDGNSRTGSTLPLSITVSPSPEATIVNSTTLNEDQLVRVNFDLQQQNGESNESLQSLWIKAADVESKDFTLYYDSDGIGGNAPQTLAAAGFVADGGYYKLTAEQSQHIYVKNLHDKSGTYTFEVKYEITDPTSDGTTVPIIAPDGNLTGSSANSATQQTTQSYTLTVNAVTDPIAGATGTITALDRTTAPKTDVNGNQITIHGSTTLTIPVRVTQVDDAAESPGGQDIDSSELLKRFILDGVPEGITVVGGTYIGDSFTTSNTARWLFDISDTPFTTGDGGSLTQNITLNIDGTAAELKDLSPQTITITAESEDTGSAIVKSATVSVILTFDPAFDDSGKGVDTPALIDVWKLQPLFTAEEDHASTLADLTTATISGSSNFSITLKNIPDGTIVTGMKYELLPSGETLYTASSTGSNAELQNLLNSITLQPPANWNANNHDNLFAFNLTLTTYASGGQQKSSSFFAQPEVLPVTDPTTITITAPPANEDNSETFTISFSNPADDLYANLVNGTLYLRVDESSMVLTSGGILSYNGSPITAESVSGISGVPDGSYYRITGVNNSSTLTFLYTPQEHAAGSVGVVAYINNHESNANSADIVTSSKSATITINPVIDGYQVTSITATGDEDTKIPLVLSGAGLIDNDDGSESVKSVLLKDVHNDYLVYAGADAASATLAVNAGRDILHNTWALGSSVPAYIAILPPKNVSATINDIILTVFTAENGLATLQQDSFFFNLIVNPVADGITISPTHSFGTEGQKVTMNLNASMADFDGSETATLTLQGLGQYASFYDASGTLVTAANYESGSDTYTLSNLTVDDTNNLSVLQSARNIAGVTVTASTLDNGSLVPSTTVTGSFSLNIAAFNPSNGDDTLLYDGAADHAGTRSYNALAGNDTLVLRLGESIDFADRANQSISNIETIDLTVSGNHTIQNLTYQDVVALTDFRHDLYILGDSGDTLQLDALNGWNTPVVSGSYNLYTNNAEPTVALYVNKTINQS